MRKSGRLAHVLAAVTFVSGCRVALPDVANVPSVVNDPGLTSQADQCSTSLNKLRDSASGEQSYADGMTITGGSLAAVGGVTAAIIPAASSDANSSGSKAGTITAAAIAAAGAIVALLSKTADSPTIPLELHKLKEAHWIAAVKVINQATSGTPLTTVQRAYASSRLTDCLSSDPPKDVPPLPPGTTQLLQ
jgi:hypothetical protein